MINAGPSNAYSARFTEYFTTLKDPRRTTKGNIQYPLMEIFFLTVMALLCGQSDYQCIEEFGKLNLDWLQKYYPYKKGVCSHDVINRLFKQIDFELFDACFMLWARQNYSFTQTELIAIDGKRIKGSGDAASGKLATHMVSAYLSSQELCIAQVATEEKSNEITAIPQLLDKIDIEGAVVSIDAMGCQVDIAEKIISKNADYLLAVKDNQKDLHYEVSNLFEMSLPSTTHTSTGVGHGRVEKRTATMITDLIMMEGQQKWTGLNSVLKIDSERYIKYTQKTTYETRYYISSCQQYSAEKMNYFVRQHWSIENKLHWHLDVNFGEDASKKRKDDSAKNFNLINKVVLTLLKRDTTTKGSLKIKKLRASFDRKFREILLNL